jgi:hypothetical protein
MSVYPSNWKEIAFCIKSKANWRCQQCRQQCLRPGEPTHHLTKGRKAAITLQVHHWNRQRKDNREENLVALCSACHLSKHCLGQSNVTPGQLELKLFRLSD